MRTCQHCGAPEAEVEREVCAKRCPHRYQPQHECDATCVAVPMPHEWSEVDGAEKVREQVLGVLRTAYPSALAQLALHCRDHDGHGDTFSLVTPEGTITLGTELLNECVQRELARRFQKSADRRGKGT